MSVVDGAAQMRQEAASQRILTLYLMHENVLCIAEHVCVQIKKLPRNLMIRRRCGQVRATRSSQ